MKLREILKQEGGNNNYVMVIFLDISNAFNNVWWPAILEALRRMKVPGDIYLLIRDYLLGRQVLIRVGEREVRKGVNKGCP